jgi:hypothetical protein
MPKSISHGISVLVAPYQPKGYMYRVNFNGELAARDHQKSERVYMYLKNFTDCRSSAHLKLRLELQKLVSVFKNTIGMILLSVKLQYINNSAALPSKTTTILATVRSIRISSNFLS